MLGLFLPCTLRIRCNSLATHCNTLQHTATHCNSLQITATHCNSLHLTAPHCNTLQHTATHNVDVRSLQHTTTHCNTQCRRTNFILLALHTTHPLQQTYKSLQHTATHCNSLQLTAPHCTSLQHSATHYNTQCTRTMLISFLPCTPRISLLATSAVNPPPPNKHAAHCPVTLVGSFSPSCAAGDAGIYVYIYKYIHMNIYICVHIYIYSYI